MQCITNLVPRQMACFREYIGTAGKSVTAGHARAEQMT